MKTSCFLVFVAFVGSCSPAAPDAAAFLAWTDRQSYTVSDQFAATVTFMNTLDRTIVIINSGCGFPGFTLERLADDSWVPVGGPLCVALAVPPTVLARSQRFAAHIRMSTERLQSGTYRLRFLIRESDGRTPLPEGYLASNRFSINSSM